MVCGACNMYVWVPVATVQFRARFPHFNTDVAGIGFTSDGMSSFNVGQQLSFTGTQNKGSEYPIRSLSVDEIRNMSGDKLPAESTCPCSESASVLSL